MAAPVETAADSGWLGDWLALFRPLHWSKNVFVLMPLPFALATGAHVPVAHFLAGLVAFCLANSAVYAFNDAQDAARDRLHKTKRLRPIAAGRISEAAARRAAAMLAAAALALAVLATDAQSTVIVALYLIFNAAYSLGARNVPLVDVFILSSGFVLRVLLGCTLLDVPPSSWLLLCSSSLALFLGLAKRRADLSEGAISEYRPVLAHYNLQFLDQAMTITATSAVLGYALYSIAAPELIAGREFAPLPFVVLGVLDYLRIATVRGEGGDPVKTILSSPTLFACGLGWVVTTLWSIRWP